MADLIGRTLIKRYRVESSIGRGGMAEVYRAFDMRRGYPVALKVLREDLAEDWEFLRRFKAEAESLARLAHQNIVRFYSFDQDGPLAFIVMDYVEGDTLRRRLFERQGQPMPPMEALGILRQVAAALEFAHGEGLIHRDVKPGNIMLKPDGTALLSDFGIAKAADAATVTTMAPGTPAYMSPEQCRGDRLDARSDVYSLGIVLYEMLAGRRPFVGEGAPDTITGGTLERVRWEQLHAEPPDPRTYNHALTKGIVQVLRSALAKAPGARCASTAALCRAFEACCRAAEAGAEPTQETGRSGLAPDLAVAQNGVTSRVSTPSTTRRPAHSAVATAGVALVFIAGAFLGGLALRGRMTISAPPSLAASSATPSFVAADPASRSESPTCTAQPATPSATLSLPIAFGPTAAGLATATALPTSTASETSRPTAMTSPSVTPTLATASTPFVQVGAATLNLRRVSMIYAVVGQATSGQAYSVVARNPDSTWLRLAGAEDRWIAAELVSLRGSAHHLAVPAHLPAVPTPTPASSLPVATPSPAPVVSSGPGDGRIAFISEQDEKTQINVIQPDGSGLQTIREDSVWLASLSWSLDGKQIAFTNGVVGGIAIYAMNADGSNVRFIRTGAGPAWSPDGSQIAYNADGKLSERKSVLSDIFIMSADGSNPVAITDSPNISENQPIWSPDGKRIAFTSSDAGLWAMNTDGSNVTDLQVTTDHAAAAWSPDGSSLLFSGVRAPVYNSEVYRLDLRSGKVVNLTGNGAKDWYAVWSPDGKQIAFVSSRDGPFEIYIMSSDGSNPRRVTSGSGIPDEALLGRSGYRPWNRLLSWVR